jgi:flagellar biosynthesis protein FliP
VRRSLLLRILLLAAAFIVAGAGAAWAQTAPNTAPPPFELLPELNIGGEDADYALPIQLLLLLTVLSLAPAIMILMTSFTRLIVVFGILRTALGMQQSPPTQVIIGLSLFLTLFIMYPVIERVNEDALQPLPGR